MPITVEQIADFLEAGAWRNLFDGSAIAQGEKLARARLVKEVHAEQLDTGDAEITSTVHEKDSTQHQAVIALWLEGDSVELDASCSCDVATNCRHSVATLERLQVRQRLEAAFGLTPQADEMKGADKSLQLDEPEEKITTRDDTPSFVIRVECRPEGNERLNWLPEIYAHAQAIYAGEHRVSLLPSGILPPIVTPDGKIHRDREAEMEALQLLYAIDLLPGAEEPPHSLRKVATPPQQGSLWAPDRKKWPHPEFYWQRFRHEATSALEARGWQVQFATHVGHKPLVFRTDSWEAQIVEEGRGWFNLSAGFEIDGESFELQPILATLVENEFLEATEGMPSGQEFMIFLPDGRGLALPVGRFRNILTTLGALLEFKFTDGPIKLSKLDAAALSEDENLEAEVPVEIKEVAARVSDFTKIERVPVPAGLKADLRQYQLDGYHWMQFLARYELNGILADDMGLGKTLQTIAHILAEKESGRDGGLPSLVIAPTSVVENWQREAAKFAPDLKMLILQGADRAARYRQIPDTDIVLTSYALIHRDLEVFAEHRFHILALDEAQHIKNPAAKVSGAVRQIDAKHRLCLSGTPIENHLGELWSLMDFLMPGMLGTAETFNETYRTPIERNGSASRSAALAARVGPLILRRTKHDVAKELPPKTEVVHKIELGEQQKDLYETVRATMDKKVRDALALHGTQSQIVFLDALMKLRQICCHPSLLKDQSHATESSKFEFLTDLLQTLRREGHRVLLFSQFTSMLSIIEEHLIEENCSYLKLTGETKDRQTLVERFQGGEAAVFLISLKAGGTGLTLTGADTVIHYDPWWNPAAENQATDRAYRIGQDKPVIVHKLLCKNTVEERIQQMQGKKDNLATDLLSGATQQLTLTQETLATLLSE
ncbi:MAG: superfamily II DNA or RNA helicase [Verrucomicrobiales bacterium]